MATFSKVLVANRGEIAIRIFRTLRDLGVGSVAVYSDADRAAQHPRYADEAYRARRRDVGRELSGGREAARGGRAARAPARSIPGTAFSPRTPRSPVPSRRQGLVWIGPPPASIELMGSKTRARQAMQAAGVPIIPGTTEPVGSAAEVVSLGAEIGYPLLIKAAAGGGGKGMKVVSSPDEAAQAFESAQREGLSYFADASVYVEKYLEDPRHVEVQVLADAHGNVVHLGERDCTIQRRHQKLVEETPSPAVGAELRARIGQIAVDAARAAGYRSAGTIEGPARARRLLLLHGDEHARPGRAHDHGARLRRRHRARADPDRVGASRCSSRRTRSGCRGTRSSAGSTPRIRRAASCRRPGRSPRTASRPGRACGSTPASPPARWSRRSTTRWSRS